MCGMTRKEDVAHAVALGADAIGLIFYAKSSRNVSIDHAKALLDGLSPFVAATAVLVNPDQEFVQQIIAELPVTLLQFHGDESPEFCKQFKIPYIKAIHPESKEQIIQMDNEFSEARAILLDTASGNMRGGTGLTFDWHIIPEKRKHPYILAGGLNQLNLNEAVRTCKPYAVDVCSGIEASPGIKDHFKMSQFTKALWGQNE